MWQKKARKLLAVHQMRPLDSDDAVYRHQSKQLIAVSHVDDFLIIGENAAVTDLIVALEKQVKVTRNESADWFLGVQIVRSVDSTQLNQRLYIERLLQSLQMDSCRPVATPIEKAPLSVVEGEGEDHDPQEKATDYAHIVGKLMYAACVTRPDIQYAVSFWSRFLSKPTEEHSKRLKRVLRYLRGSIDLAIRYTATATANQPYNKLGLYGVADASFANDPQQAKSVSGFVFFMAGGPITWSSRLQSVVAQSTTEAEYYAINEAAREAAWIRNFLTELGALPVDSAPIPILNDNNGALTWSAGTTLRRESRHVKVRYHYVREEIERGAIKLQYVSTKDCAADGLTKPLDRTEFGRFVQLLHLDSTSETDNQID